jgi:uncharacterized membrane protein YdjX (TVP38/TMEM64 family)
VKKNLPVGKIVAFVAVSALVLVVMLAITLWSLPFLKTLSDSLDFRARVRASGLGGWLVVLGIQILQIVIAFIPGEAVQILCGILYGTVGGLFTCLVGSVIASILVFSVMKRFGKPFIDRMIGKKNLEKWAFLRNGETTDAVVFIAFLVPGTPKDALTYVASLTGISLWRFILISTVARIPAMLASTMIGSNMQRGRWVTTVILAGVGCALLVFFALYRERVLALLAGLKRKKSGQSA